MATSYIAAVGGTDNLKAIDACITRLRLTVADSGRVNDAMCKRLGASGVVKLNKQTIQVIVGAKAESIGDEMKKVVARIRWRQRLVKVRQRQQLQLQNRRLSRMRSPLKRWYLLLPVMWLHWSRFLMKPSPAKQ